MLTDTKNPNIELRPNTESIASCNVCGAPNYTRVTGREDAASFQPTGLALYDLRISPNGFQTVVTKVCRSCLEALHDAACAVLFRGDKTVTWRK